MSAFAAIYVRSSMTRIPDGFNRVMQRLSHRGPDGSDVLSLGAVTMGHWHFWTTPEEVGEHQPVGYRDLPLKIVLDGRIDNRSEILTELEIDPIQSSRLSDAVLVMLAYNRWKQACFARFVGEFALVIFDQSRNELICARDHLGDRTLFFAPGDRQFAIASEPWALLGESESSPKLNMNSIACYFAARVPEEGQTFFTGVYELPPAHFMIVNASGHSLYRYWQPDIGKKIRFQTEQEYAEHFLALLEESIRCRMRSTTPVGVLMSGGLDSTSIACLAARMLSPQQLTTISNVYDELPECDEREYMEAAREQWNLRSIPIPCDDNWTFKNWAHWPHVPNQPEGNVYRLNLERDYHRARTEGLRVLFTGEVGDPLYVAGQEWLADLLEEGRFDEVLAGVKMVVNLKGWRYFIESGHLRSTIRAYLRRFAPSFLSWRRRQSAPPKWLNLQTRKLLRQRSKQNITAHERYETLLSPFYAYTCSRENINASRHDVELRFPYHDRRLVEYMIGIPAYLLHYGGLYKHILRIAMHGILPDAIRTRKKSTFLTPLFRRGLEREPQILSSGLHDGNHVWEKFVDPKWLRTRLSMQTQRERGSRELFVAWLCISFEKWHGTLMQSK